MYLTLIRNDTDVVVIGHVVEQKIVYACTNFGIKKELFQSSAAKLR